MAWACTLLGLGLKSYACARARYEGEFHSGFAHGLGMYTSHEGEIYRGEFLLGKRNGRALLPPPALPPRISFCVRCAGAAVLAPRRT